MLLAAPAHANTHFITHKLHVLLLRSWITRSITNPERQEQQVQMASVISVTWFGALPG